MSYNLSYSANICESLGVLSSFSLSQTVWNKYEKFAVPKIEETTLKLRGSLYYLKDISAKEALAEVNALNQLVPILNQLRDKIEPIDDKEFHNFRVAAIEFFDTVELLNSNLHNVASVSSSYEISLPALAKDWDSEEDKHWDNY